ncbi:EamA family transporter RarD [Luteimonas panaciterrae]|uniref:EamA family transporter RarD n=1 Tax=Luteimonas panaciterrae TaxID=363885 RepID=UPI001CFB7AF6|nr:EamA family transporter RarD [Luteimonas panaciterrae]
MTPTLALDRRGLWTAAASFVLWGLMPLYWHALKAVPSLQIVLHRVVWSTILVVGWLCWKQGVQWWRALLSQPRVAGLLALSGTLIAFNWSLYIWAVNAGHVVETSLGYFINPLLNVVLGVLLLREKLTSAQWLAAGIATIGVLWLTFNYGSFPWIALALAGSFGLYGLVRKIVAVDSIPGLGIESLYLFLPALALLVWSETHGAGQFFSAGWGTGMDALLVLAGALTALPLIGFAYAVRRVPYSIIGLMQYIAPTLQFLIGVFVLHEPFDRDRLIGFVFIWISLAIFAGEGWWRSRRRVVAEAT